MQQVKFTTPWRSSFVIDVAYARLRDDDRFDPRPEVSNGAISRFDSATNTFTEAWPTYNFNLHKRDQAHASISYFAGTHDIRAGYSHLRQRQAVGDLVDVGDARRLRQRPARSWFAPTTSPSTIRRRRSTSQPLFTQGNREQGYYIQDKWTPTRKLVINFGVRFESNYGWQDATCQPVTVFFTTGALLRRHQGRAGSEKRAAALCHRLRPEGRRPNGAEIRREPLRPADSDGVRRPAESGWCRRATSGSGCRRAGAAIAGVRGCDRNGDLIPQIDELGPSGGFALGSTARYADDLKYPVSNEYNWRGSAAAAGQHGALGRVHPSADPPQPRPAEHGGSGEHVHADHITRADQRHGR